VALIKTILLKLHIEDIKVFSECRGEGLGKVGSHPVNGKGNPRFGVITHHHTFIQHIRNLDNFS
jgi:hypothetical protein